MDNNNTIPYGAVTWESDRSARESHQRVERQVRNSRPPSLTNSGAMFSFTRPSSSRLSVNPHTPHNSILTGAFEGLRNSSRRITQPTSGTNITSLQQPANNPVLSPGYPSSSSGTVWPHGSVNHNTGANSQAVGCSLNPHPSMNLFPPNVSWVHSASSNVMNIPGQSRQNFRMEGMVYPQTGVTRSKRKMSTEHDEESSCSASKQLLTERMATKMYNLRISNDVDSYRKSLSRLGQLDSGNQRITVDSAGSSNNMSRMEEEEPDESKDKANRNDIPTFVIASGVKEALKKNDSILPDAIVRHINTPCLALIPWKPANDLPFLSTNSTKKVAANKIHQESYRKTNCIGQDIVVDQDTLVNPERMPAHTYDTFPLEDDEMDL